jgi:hypothetical protein
MRCVILQPSYIPWRGYFDQIDRADVFVFYDDVQYDKHGWRNRNRIKTPHGPQWLSIPVYHQGTLSQKIPICDIQICWETAWNLKHWNAIKTAYGPAPFFREYAPQFEAFYQRRYTALADFTIELTQTIASILGIVHTAFIRSSSLQVTGTKTDRLLEILKTQGATDYLSGPSAKDYLEEEKLRDAGIQLQYIGYDYPEYAQLYPPFDPQVSILDLIFMTGPKALSYIRKYSIT